MEKGLVSVIVPVYNCKDYLEQCINSILSQSYKNIELIIVDDGSNDGSNELINNCSKKDRRIKFISNSNHGISYSRNCGIKKSNGEYLLFVDSDDELLPNYIELMLKKISDFNSDLIICGYEKKYVNKTIRMINKNKIKKDDLIDNVIDNKCIGGFVWNKLYKSDIIKENSLFFKENVYYNEDTIFNIEYIKYIYNVEYVNNSLYAYRMRKSAASYKMFNKKNASILISYETILNLIDPKNEKLIKSIKYKYLKSYYNNKKYLSKDFVVNKIILNDERNIVRNQSGLEKAKFFIIKHFNPLFKVAFKINHCFKHYYK